MIRVEQLTKKYAATVAVDNLSFRVDRGEVVGFLGPNGAGKTTTMRIISGYLPATGGRVEVAGRDVFKDSMEVRKRIGYLPENCPLYLDMRVDEYLKYRANLKGVPLRDRKERIREVKLKCSLMDVSSRIIGQLSKGYRQRVGLADALLGSPPVLILDEPSAGLDPNQIRQVRDLIRNLGGKQTVLLSSHILPEIEATCCSVVVIDRGQLVAKGSIDEIRLEQAPVAVRLLLANCRDTLVTQFEDHQLVQRLSKTASRRAEHTSLLIELSDDGVGDVGEAIAALVACAVDAGARVHEATPEAPSLEDVFSRLTRSEETEKTTEKTEPEA
jgi:ABC-2 type transport system ATP-binding protein